MSSEITVGPNTRVFLNFSISLETGEEVDSNFDRAPVDFVMGDGSLLPGFEACLMDLKGGDEAAFEVAPQDGFGEPHPDNFKKYPDLSLAPIPNCRAAWCFRLRMQRVENCPGSSIRLTMRQSVLTSIIHSG